MKVSIAAFGLLLLFGAVIEDERSREPAAVINDCYEFYGSAVYSDCKK